MKPAKLFIASIVYCAVAGLSFSTGGDEGVASDEGVQLKYTYRYNTSGVMEHLSTSRLSGLLLYDIELISWGSRGVGWEQCTGFYEHMFLTVETGNASDLLFTICNDRHIEELREQGYFDSGRVFRTIPGSHISIVETPNLKRLWDTHPRIFETYTEDNELIAIPGISVTRALPWRLPIIRLDWLEEYLSEEIEHADRIAIDGDGIVQFIDLQLSTDELFEIMQAIKNDKLNGRPPVALGRWNGIWPVLMGAYSLPVIEGSRGTNVTAYGIPNTTDTNDDRKVRASVLTSQYCWYVKEAARWYRELLPDEVFDNGEPTPTLIKHLLDGEAAIVLSGHTGVDWDRIAAAAVEAIEKEEIDELARLAILPPPTGPGGAQGTHARSKRNGTFLVVGARLSDHELITALRVLEYVKLTPEGYLLEHYGMEEQHYTWREDQRDYIHQHGSYIGPPEEILNKEGRPHFPRYPSFDIPGLYEVKYKHGKRNMIELISREDAQAWTRLPEIWLTRWNSNVSPQLIAIGEEINEWIERRFIDMVTSDVTDEALTEECKRFQSVAEMEGVGKAWELTKEYGERYKDR